MALRADDAGVIVPCPACQTPNRVRFEHLARQPRCASCKAGMPHVSQPVEVSSVAQFDALLKQSAVPVLVDFWAPWCGPCHAVAPEVEKVAYSLRGRLLTVKVNTDVLQELGARYTVRSIPTLAVFAHGREADRVSGVMAAAEIVKLVERHQRL
jgi:thioredoxin 2